MLARRDNFCTSTVSLARTEEIRGRFERDKSSRKGKESEMPFPVRLSILDKVQAHFLSMGMELKSGF